MVELPTRYPSSSLTNERQEEDKKKGITPLPPMPLPSPEPAPYRYIIWSETSRRPCPPGSPSLFRCTLLWNTAQKPARVGICPLSSPPPFPPISIVLAAGLSTGCSGGRGALASWSGSLSLHTTSMCCDFGGQTVLGRLWWVYAYTVIGRT